VDVEDAVLPRDDLDARDLALELLEDPRRQTDGVLERASGDAVLDADAMLARHAVDATQGW
jgi:citrate lyase beta subunit